LALPMRNSGSAHTIYSTRQLADDLRHHRMQIVGLLVVAMGMAVFAAMLGLTRGAIVSSLSEALLRLFGIGAPAVALAIVIFGGLLTLAKWMRPKAGQGRQALGLALLWVASMVLSEAVSPSLAGARWSFGGAMGRALAVAFSGIGGRPLVWLAGLGLAVEGIYLVARLSWRRTLLSLSALAAVVGRWLISALSRVTARYRSKARAPEPELMEQRGAIARASVAVAAPEAEKRAIASDIEDAEEAGAEANASTEITALATDTGTAPEPTCEGRQLPPLELLDAPGSDESDEAYEEPEDLSRDIEDTLDALGIPGKVRVVERGPAVTRYGVEPGYLDKESADGLIRRKVRVSRIAAVSDDLALALGAAPIRIEAPIPGKPLVGIEVPNPSRAKVRIREVLESREYQQANFELKIALGEDITGRPYVTALENAPHLLIAGATNSGKSVCISAILTSLLYAYQPEQVRLLLIDPKRVELMRYNGIPHLLGRVEADVEGCIAALRWAGQEMDERYREFARVGVKDIAGYNRSRPEDAKPYPRFVIVIDELSDLMMTAGEEVELAICRLAQKARATGIHLVVATQRPSVDVVTGVIKANFPARIAFHVATNTDSRVILDGPGAESLIGHGDMLFLDPSLKRAVRLQGSYVSEEETRRLVAHWRAQVGTNEMLPVCPWAGLLEARDSAEDDEDDLLIQAEAIARESSSISASYLQRRLKIGYPRAAHLLDRLQKMGVVGDGPSGRPRPVLAHSDNRTDEDDPAAEPGGG